MEATRLGRLAAARRQSRADRGVRRVRRRRVRAADSRPGDGGARGAGGRPQGSRGAWPRCATCRSSCPAYRSRSPSPTSRSASCPSPRSPACCTRRCKPIGVHGDAVSAIAVARRAGRLDAAHDVVRRDGAEEPGDRDAARRGPGGAGPGPRVQPRHARPASAASTASPTWILKLFGLAGARRTAVGALAGGADVARAATRRVPERSRPARRPRSSGR